MSEVREFECRGCGGSFRPGDLDQAVCDNCRDTNPGLADRARMAADCEPLTLKGEEWYEEYSLLVSLGLEPYREEEWFTA